MDELTGLCRATECRLHARTQAQTLIGYEHGHTSNTALSAHMSTCITDSVKPNAKIRETRRMNNTSSKTNVFTNCRSRSISIYKRYSSTLFHVNTDAIEHTHLNFSLNRRKNRIPVFRWRSDQRETKIMIQFNTIPNSNFFFYYFINMIMFYENYFLQIHRVYCVYMFSLDINFYWRRYGTHRGRRCNYTKFKSRFIL